MARQPPESAHGARDHEPRLAALLRPRAGEDFGRFRHARRKAFASGAARLAGYGIRSVTLELEGDAPVDCHFRHVSSILEGDAGTRESRPGEHSSGARSTRSRRRPNWPRHRTGVIAVVKY